MRAPLYFPSDWLSEVDGVGRSPWFVDPVVVLPSGWLERFECVVRPLERLLLVRFELPLERLLPLW